jgi:phospholipid/cholesterol/gamma-HCH transport system substrate-binding protein
MNAEAKVGVFVLASIVLLATTIYFVRTTQTVHGQVAFRAYFRDAGGLAADAGVLFGGIKVGRITTVHPSADDPTRIEVVFEVASGTPVNAQSTARVGTVTVMGSPALQITTGSNEAPRLRAGDVVVSEETLSTSEIMRRVGTVVESANALLVDARREIPALTGRLQAVLDNVAALTGSRNQRQIRTVLAEAETLLRHADAMVVSAGPLVSNLDRTVTNVNGTVDAVRKPLVEDLEGLGHTLADARTVLRSLQDVVSTNQEDIAQTLGALRTTSENLRILSEQLKQRPWSLVRTAQPEDREVPK